MSNEPTRGRIVTFYSYKGGTGRSMALANVAWILATNGKRVLVIDWDLEAPGLHRYFHPFLEDKDLLSSPGLIDYFVDFSAAARVATRRETSTRGEPWWQSWTSLFRYTYPLAWEFPPDTKTGALEGTIDFVPAGQQGAQYAARVASFNWQEFYERLGGGVFLQAVKQRLRERYDFVLVDSRTGISDTAGICTVQLPDDLVVCFTLNQQSIKGAEAVADSADAQRRRPSGEPGLHIWPVPMRVELAEKERLDAARHVARATFSRYLGHLSREKRADYWGRVEVLYHPFFAYEEVLATFAERRRQTNSLLASMEVLAGLITGTTTEVKMAEPQRLEGLKKFERPRPTLPRPSAINRPVYISYNREDGESAQLLADALRYRDVEVSWDRALLKPGDEYASKLSEALDASSVAIVLVGKRLQESEWQQSEIMRALAMRKRVVPVLVGGAGFDHLPPSLTPFKAVEIRPGHATPDLDRLAEDVAALARLETGRAHSAIDPDDPQKDQWGGLAARNGREIVASVRAVSDDWFEVTLEVRATTGPRLAGQVEFHLHSTFKDPDLTVDVVDGRAELHLAAWGAFTAVADDGKTMLELDLSENPSFPSVFVSR